LPDPNNGKTSTAAFSPSIWVSLTAMAGTPTTATLVWNISFYLFNSFSTLAFRTAVLSFCRFISMAGKLQFQTTHSTAVDGKNRINRSNPINRKIESIDPIP